MAKDKLPKELSSNTQWDQSESPIWLGSCFTLKRNLQDQLFPAKAPNGLKVQLFDLLKEAFLKTKAIDNAQIFPSHELSAQEKDLLFEHYLVDSCSLREEKGLGLVIDGTNRFLGFLNFQDHLTLMWSTEQKQWQKTWLKLQNLERELSEKLVFAYSPRFGYLTHHIFEAGTAFICLAYLHLPALIQSGTIESMKDELKELGLKILGIEKSENEFVGDLIILQNRYTLGLPEEEILKSVHSGANKLVSQELQEREKLIDDPRIKDQISRAFGLLTHSYELHAKETLNALSALKLGIHYNYLKGIDDKELSKLFFHSRQAHLTTLHNQSLNREELLHKRSEYLQEKLRSSSLKI